MRSYSWASHCDGQNVHLALSAGLTPQGVVDSPSFFHGFLTMPHVVARALLALSDITATRYFNYTPESQRDPILSAHGDRLRAECFSACNGVYACLEIGASGLDGGDIGRGTTNVDIGDATRDYLMGVSRSESLHIDIGGDGLSLASAAGVAAERPVRMPRRWVRALGNSAEMHSGFVEAFRVGAQGARAFLASLPPSTAQNDSGYLSASRGRVRVARRATSGAVLVNGLNRLSALKRLTPVATGLAVYGRGASGGPCAVVLQLPHAAITIGMTETTWRGYSGEGALLGSLASQEKTTNAALVAARLAFDPVIDICAMTRQTSLTQQQVTSALAVLASTGCVGWDLETGTYYHRELPSDADALATDNPRLTHARTLLERGSVTRRRENSSTHQVTSGNKAYIVQLTDPQDDNFTDAKCTCAWFISHRGTRGPCKHLLAAYLHEQQETNNGR